MAGANAPYHAHIYFGDAERERAEALRSILAERADILFVGPMREGRAGPHPIPQYEIHFLAGSLPALLPILEASGLRTLVHPLTLDDRADHTSLGHWIGEPVDLDLSALDPPGINQGMARFGKRDV